MNFLDRISGTVSIEIEENEGAYAVVYIDYYVAPGQVPDQWSVEYDTSDPYVLLGPSKKKAKAFVTPLELARLEDLAKDAANGVGE